MVNMICVSNCCVTPITFSFLLFVLLTNIFWRVFSWCYAVSVAAISGNSSSPFVLLATIFVFLIPPATFFVSLVFIFLMIVLSPRNLFVFILFTPQNPVFSISFVVFFAPLALIISMIVRMFFIPMINCFLFTGFTFSP